MKIMVEQEILRANNDVADENRGILDHLGIYAMNLLGSPGAGKTSLILATLERLPHEIRPAVIEGDVASRIDADTLAARGVPVTQINTAGGCHLEAPMVRDALPDLPIERMDLLVVENVGNLVCTANFALGAHVQVVVASVPEGHDKPFKYPGIFAAADAIVLNKADTLPFFDFDLPSFQRGIALVNPRVPYFIVSCRNGEGLDAWVTWLLERMRTR